VGSHGSSRDEAGDRIDDLETDRDGADFRINSEVRCRKCAGCVKALFPALMALLGGLARYLFDSSFSSFRLACGACAALVTAQPARNE
jgi:hypothetical protein